MKTVFIAVTVDGHLAYFNPANVTRMRWDREANETDIWLVDGTSFACDETPQLILQRLEDHNVQ